MKTAIRVLTLILVFFLGFFSCIGAIVGVGYYGYANVSWDQLNKWGIVGPNNGEIFSTEIDEPVNTLTLKDLVEHIKEFQELDDGLTMDYLISRYGVKLPESMDEILVEELRTLPLNKVASKDGLNIVLEHVSVGTVLKFVPEGVVSEPAKEALKDKTLKQVVDGNFGELLTGVKLGYLLGVTYQLEGEIFVPVYQNPDEPTVFELLAPLDLGNMLTVMSEGGDLLAVVHDAIADVAIIQLVKSFMTVEEGPLFELLDGKEISEVIVYDEELKAYKLDFLATLSGMYVGDLLGLTPVYAENNPELLISWKDKDGNSVVGYMRGLSSFALSRLTEEGEIIDDMFLDHMYFGDILGYVPSFDADGNLAGWEGTDGSDVEPAFEKLVNKPVNDLMNGNLTIATLLEGQLLGNLLGYTQTTENEKTVWYEDEKKVTGLDAVIANINLELLLTPDSGYSFISAFEGQLMGHLLGYTPDGEKWMNGDTEVTGIDAVIAKIDIEALLNPDKDYNVTDAFNGSLLGDVLGYEYVPSKNHWYNGDNAVSIVENAIADIDMGDLLGDSSFKITEAFDDTFLGDLLGYERGDAVNPDETKDEEKQYVWFEKVTENGSTRMEKVDGIQEELANYNLYKIMEGKQTLSTEDFTIGELLGIHSELCYIYLDGTPVLKDGVRMTVELWLDADGKRVNGVLSALANAKIQELNNVVNTLKIGSVVEYITLDNGTDGYFALGEVTTYIDNATNTSEKRVTVTKAKGVMTYLASLSINDLSDPSAVSAQIQEIRIGDVMGWYEEGGVWYTDETKAEKPTGTLAALAGSKMNTLNTDVQSIQIGSLLGYTEVGGVWYSEYNTETNTGTKITGTLASILGFKVNELEDEIPKMKVGTLLGYTQNDAGEWVETKTENGATTETVLSGVMAKIADFEVGSLSTRINEMKIGDIIGWTEKNGEWYEVYEEGSSDNVLATGIMTHFASLSINDMTDNGKVSGVIGNMQVGDALSWYHDTTTDKWYESEASATPVEGIMQLVAGMRVNELNTKINGLTIGSILGWTDHDGTWHSACTTNGASKCEDASGIMVNLAHLTIDQLKDAGAVSGAIQNARLGDAMGWHEKDGEWYTDTACTVKAQGTLAKMADTLISHMDERIQSLTVADALLFEPGAEEGVYYHNGEKVMGIMAVIADTPLSGINDKIHTTMAGDLLDYIKGDAQMDDEKKTPYDSNGNPDDDVWYHLVTKTGDNDVTYQVWEPCSKIQNYIADHAINELDQTLANLTIGDVVEYDAEDDMRLSLLIGDDWEQKSIHDFFHSIVNAPDIQNIE